MSRLFTGASLALLLAVAPLTAAGAAPAASGQAAASKPAKPSKPGAFCKTLKGEWVGFGEPDTRKEAEDRLDKEIAAWREKYQVAAAKPKDRKVGCNIYLSALNEYFCTAEAVVCR